LPNPLERRSSSGKKKSHSKKRREKIGVTRGGGGVSAMRIEKSSIEEPANQGGN